MNSNENNNAVAIAAPELDLFSYSTPKSTGTLVITERKSEVTGKVTGRAMVLPKRKDVAARLGVQAKDGAVTAELRAMSDMILDLGIAEFQSGAREGKITGARFAKSASGRITLSAVPIEKRVLTAEQMEAAFLAMTPAERKEFIAKHKNVKAPQQAGITIEAETGRPAKRNRKAKTPAKTAAVKTDAQPSEQPAQPEAAPEENVPALDNQKSELPEAAPAQ